MKFLGYIFTHLLLSASAAVVSGTTEVKVQLQQQEQAPAVAAAATPSLRSAASSSIAASGTTTTTPTTTATTTTWKNAVQDSARKLQEDNPLSDAFLRALDANILWIIGDPEFIPTTAVVGVVTALAEDMIETFSDGRIGCAWGTYTQGGELDFETSGNEIFPDTVANYWITRIYQSDPIPILGSPVIKVKGKRPSARYFSFQTYLTTDLYTTVYGDIRDNEIKFNKDDTYEIIINGENNGNTNEIASFPDGQDSGYLSVMFRTYLSDPDTSPAGGVDLPEITLGYPFPFFPEQTIDYCNKAEPKIKPQTASNPKPEYEFSVPPDEFPERVSWFLALSETSVPYPNNDVGYLATIINPVKDYVTVIRGKAPEYINAQEVRYWSICKFGLPSTAVNGCIYDEIATLDKAGYYTIVIAGDKPKAPKDSPKFDFIHFGPEVIGTILLRNLVSDKSFSEAIENIPPPEGDDIRANDAVIQSTIGEYYPETVYCPVEVIEQAGILACFGGK